MLSFVELEPEIICHILEFINDTSPKTIKAVACVCRYLNDVTKLIAHRHKTINIHTGSGLLSETWTSDELLNETILANIRTLTIAGKPYKGVDILSVYDSDWDALAKLLSKIGKLQQMTWTVRLPLPEVVLDALEKYQPTATLILHGLERTSPDLGEPTAVEKRLAASKALTFIRHQSKYFTLRDEFQELVFRFIVGSAPNLAVVSFLRARNESYMPANWKQCTPEQEAAFATNQPPNASVRQLTLDGYEISKKTLLDWETIVDLTRLEKVKFSRGVPHLDYFLSAADLLPNLKHLSLNLISIGKNTNQQDEGVMVAAVANYITSCSPLQSLSLWSWMGIVTVDQILQRHGATLEYLQLHERETVFLPRKLLELEDIIAIREKCPRLNEFSFDLRRTDAHLRWDRDDENRQYYQELAKFPRLDKLQIYFDCGVSYLDNVEEKDIDYDYDEHSEAGDEEDEEDDDEADDMNGPAPAPATATAIIAANNHTSSSSSSSSSPPPPKRRRIQPTNLRPTRDIYFSLYARQIWRTIFASSFSVRSHGPRHLDLKFGEWEGAMWEFEVMARVSEWMFRRYLVVRPHERDDAVVMFGDGAAAAGGISGDGAAVAAAAAGGISGGGGGAGNQGGENEGRKVRHVSPVIEVFHQDKLMGGRMVRRKGWPDPVDCGGIRNAEVDGGGEEEE